MTGRIMQIPLRLLQYARAAVPGGAAGAKLMAKPHGAVAKALHWGTAGMLLYAYIRNGDVTGALDSPSAMNREIMFGLAAGALFAARFFWMRYLNGGRSRLPSDAPRWEHLASKLAHHSLYIAVAAILATGLSIPLAQAYGGGGAVRAVVDVHEFVTGAAGALIFAHIAAALWHKLVRRDGIWESIGTPWWRGRKPAAKS